MFKCLVLLGIELRSDVRSVADHTGAQRPFDGEPTDDQSGNEDAGHHDGRVHSTERYGAEAVLRIDR